MNLLFSIALLFVLVFVGCGVVGVIVGLLDEFTEPYRAPKCRKPDDSFDRAVGAVDRLQAEARRTVEELRELDRRET